MKKLHLVTWGDDPDNAYYVQLSAIQVVDLTRRFRRSLKVDKFEIVNVAARAATFEELVAVIAEDL